MNELHDYFDNFVNVFFNIVREVTILGFIASIDNANNISGQSLLAHHAFTQFFRTLAMAACMTRMLSKRRPS